MVEISIVVPDDELKPYKEKALVQLGKNVQVKGFRPGHVPRQVLEQNVNPEAVLGLAIEIVVNDAYVHVIKEEKLEVITRPNVEVQSESPLTFLATVAVKPDAKVKDYKKIKVEVAKPKVSDKEVKDTIDDLLKGKGTWHDHTLGARKGDRAELDFQGYDGGKVEEGKELANTKSSNHPLILGSKTFIPGFEEEIIGMKVGETKEFTITFPKNYHVDDFKNKKVTFKATLKRLEEQKLPEYNDEFIKEATNGLKKDKKEFETYVEEVLMEKKMENNRGDAEGELIKKILKATEVEVAPQLVEMETEVIFNDYKRQIESRGIKFEKHLELSKKTAEDIKKEMSKEAEKRVKMRFALDYIIEQEKFGITENEIKKELEVIKSRYPETEHSKIAEHYKEGSDNIIRLKNMMIVGKVFDMYFKK